jgi:hypothetical protein
LIAAWCSRAGCPDVLERDRLPVLAALARAGHGDLAGWIPN